MSSAQWLHIHYIMSDEGEVLLGGKSHGDSEQVGRAELHSALLVCRMRVNTGARERSEGQAGVGCTGQRSPPSSAGCADLPKISEGRNMAGDGLQLSPPFLCTQSLVNPSQL